MAFCHSPSRILVYMENPYKKNKLVVTNDSAPSSIQATGVDEAAFAGSIRHGRCRHFEAPYSISSVISTQNKVRRLCYISSVISVQNKIRRLASK